MKSNGQVYIAYYEGSVEKRTDPCNEIELRYVTWTTPAVIEMTTATYLLWFGDDDTGHSETVTVPFPHYIRSV